MSDAPYDQHLANASTAADQCMKLGAVILHPKDTPTIGFTQQTREDMQREFERPFRK